MSPFERRFKADLDAYVGPRRSVDAGAIARSARAPVSLRRAITLRLMPSRAAGTFLRWPAAASLGLVALAVLAAAAGAILSGALRQHAPPPFEAVRNGAIVISVGDRATGQLLEINAATGVAKPLRAGGWFVAPEFSNDGRRIKFAEVTGEQAVRLFVTNANGSGVRELGPPYRDYVGSAWAPDGERIAAVRDRWLSIYDMQPGNSVGYDLGFAIGGVAWRPNHEEILVEGTENEPGEYLVKPDGTGLRQLEAAPGVWSPDGSTFAYGASDGRVHLLDVDSGEDRVLSFEGSEGTSERPEAYSPDGTKLLVRRALLGRDIAPADFPSAFCCREPWLHVVVPVAGGGPAIVLGSDEHRSLGGPGGAGVFSPDGTKVLAVYTQSPSGAWLFDPTSGDGERQSWWPGGGWQGMTWQRLTP